MNLLKLSLAFFCAAILCTMTAVDAQAQTFGRLFTVDSTSDTVDAAPGDGACMDADGKCTLRAAIEEANSKPSTRDAIVFALPNSSVIELSLGELAITGNVYIVGPGARRLSVERSAAGGTAEFRIFRVASGLTNVVIRGLKIRKGFAAANEGGGLLIESQSKVTLSDLWFDSNAADNNGGGIKNLGTINVNRTLFSSNQSARGAAVDNGSTAATAMIVNSSFYQNTGSDRGAISNAGTLTLANDTFSQNMSINSCASVCNDAIAWVLNTIFGADAGPGHSLAGTFNSLGNNIVVDPGAAIGFKNGANGDQVSDGGSIVDPKLGALANNGGETDTLALLDGSPAIDRGSNCVTDGSCSTTPAIRIRTDQRGRVRGFISTVDIGAYEATDVVSNSVFLVAFASFGRSNRYLGSLAVLTNTTTNDKRYYPLKPGGLIRLQGIPTGVYVLELKSKRAGIGFDPLLIVSEETPPISLANPDKNIQLTISEEKSKP